jgi:uncharacterized protein YqgV (UPF0045/DUF77 family)
MKISVEVSMYPLDANYIPPIQSFIDRLHQFEDIKVKTNSMSTQLFGDYAAVMDALKISLKESFMEDRKMSVVMKLINSDLDYEYQKP